MIHDDSRPDNAALERLLYADPSPAVRAAQADLDRHRTDRDELAARLVTLAVVLGMVALLVAGLIRAGT